MKVQNKKLGILILFFAFLVMFSITGVFALDTNRQNRLDFGHVMRVNSISISPSELVPGGKGFLKINITNMANFELSDIRIKLNLPSGISFSNDINKIKIAKLYAGESQELKFSLIVLPSTAEGVYDGSFTIDYLNYLGTEREDNSTFGIVVNAVPDIFVNVVSSTIYEGKNTGEVTIKFVNNNVGDVKFLTVELKESSDYKILSNPKEYIGDLDSDDFESVDFKIEFLSNSSQIELPMIIHYKDALNNGYTEKISVPLVILNAKEAGVTQSKTWIYVLLVVLLIIVYIIYKRFKKRRKKDNS